MFLRIFLSFCLILQNFALANPSNIVPDGTTNTTIETSPNGITIVEIATPTAGGTSTNNFDQFNVDQTGAILNNSSVVTNTQLGGWIYANPHLANGNQANIIVGEVTSTAPSNLLGYMEIAGGTAQFVLLNPNGISCVGCGFINLNQLTLATGSGNYNPDGTLASVNMGTGNFSVSGTGLDANLIDYFRIISKNIQLSAPIWAKDELAIYQGSSNFNTTSNTFSGTTNPNSGQLIGIDASAMGSMYAGKVLLVASDLGLGVNISSDVIASNGGITITANGDVVYNNITSATDINITANNGDQAGGGSQNITQNGALSSGGNTNIAAANNVSVAGTSLSSVGNTTITAGRNISNSGNLSLSTTNLTTNSTGNTTLQNLNALISGQTNISANNLSLTGSNIQSTNGFASNVTNSSNITNSIISSLTTTNLSSNSILINNSQVYGKNSLGITSTNLTNSNSSLINSDGTLNITSTSITNDASTLYSTGNMTLTAGSLTNTNSSIIQTGQTLNINLSSTLQNTNASKILSTLNTTINAVTATNSTGSTIKSGGNLTSNPTTSFTNAAFLGAFGGITISNLNNQNGYLEAGTSVLITNNNFGLNNSGGTIQSDNGNLTIASNYQFNNTNGQINSANDINLNINANQNYTDANSQINAGGSIYLNSAGYDITEGSGVKFTTSNIIQVISRDFTNNSNIKVGYINLNLSNNLTNNSNLVSTADSQYIIRKNITNNGTIASGATLLLQGANITNNNLISSKTNMEIAGSTSITNNTNSAIFSGGTLGIYADTLITNGSNAQMWSIGNLTLAGYGNDSVATLNNGSTAGAAYLKSQANMQIYANQVNNIGKDNTPLTEGNAYTVRTDSYGYPGMDSSGMTNQEVATNILTSTNSQIVSGGSMLINGNVLNQTGDILAGNNLTINGSVTNNVTQFTTRPLSESWANTYEDCWSSAFGGMFCSTEHDHWNTSNTTTFSSLTPSRIAAGGNLTITTNGTIVNGSGTGTYQNNTPLSGSSGGTNSGYSGSYGSSFTNSSSLTSNDLAAPSTNLNITSNTALFTTNPNPPTLHITNTNGQNINFSYSIESNIQFANQSNFLTSTYFFEHLDYNPSRQIVLIGDPVTERRIIEDTMAKAGILNASIDKLYENGLEWIQNNPEGGEIKVGVALTKSQITALTQDIIIPVEQEINGKLVMVPQVYFAANTLNEIRQHDLTGGQIFAGGNLSFTATGDIVNKGFIGSGGDTSITTGGDIINIGGELNAKSNIILSGKNVLLDALISESKQDVSKNQDISGILEFPKENAGSASSYQIQNVSKLEAGGSILINSQNDFTAKGASIHSVKDTTINADGNINIGAAYSKSSFDIGDTSETNSKSVNTTIQTGTGDATPIMIKKAENDQKIQDTNVSLAD